MPLPVGKSESTGEFTPKVVGVILENLNEVSCRITIEILKGLAALPATILGWVSLGRVSSIRRGNGVTGLLFCWLALKTTRLSGIC